MARWRHVRCNSLVFVVMLCPPRSGCPFSTAPFMTPLLRGRLPPLHGASFIELLPTETCVSCPLR
jgi:hypothetical protein